VKAHLFQHSRGGTKARLWSARIRLDGWLKARTVALHVSDKRVAEQMLEKRVQEFEREEAGIISPKLMRDGARIAIADHLNAFLADLEARGRSANTLSKYRNCIPLLCDRCKWVYVKDVTAQSFTAWRTTCGLRSKTLNDLQACISGLLTWLKKRQVILANPLEFVGRVEERSPREFRRALSTEQAQRLLNVAPKHRAAVYLTILYTGLRAAEMKRLKWEDFDLDATAPCVRVPSSISKNRKASVHNLRPELVAALKNFQPETVMPYEFAFRGFVPRVPTFKKDLKAAGIPFEDEHGRRIDIHALRKSFGTMLAVSGAPLRVGMELMRHSESRLTETVYTDASHLPLLPAINALPSLFVPETSTPRSTLAGDFSGLSESASVTAGHTEQNAEALVCDSVGHEKAPSVTTGRFHQMERAKRLELSTSTLARWCSTN
jgi:integrase